MKHFKTISEFHQFRNLPKPRHPLISVINVETIKPSHNNEPENLVLDFYFIAVKRIFNAKHATMKYGQQSYDFNDGIMAFMSPNQVFNVPVDQEEEIKQSGWVLLIHPDFLWNTSLAKTIKRYDFWNYAVNEALLLSEKEETTINSVVQNIEQEYQSNIDTFSKQIIISHIEVLLNYAERFYHRQFITREKSNYEILDRLEHLLNDYLNSDDIRTTGLPTVQYISDTLNLSPNYLRSLLKMLTGRNTQQHIHDKLIEKAKEKLSTTELSISEIAYDLGFEHLQSFSKLFKTKTNQTPLKFRQSFN